MRLRVYFLLLLEVSLHTAVSSTIKCGRPPLPSGVDGEVLQRVYEPGEDAVLSCAPGYLHAGGSRVIVCSNTGEWSTITFKCAPKSCPPPDDIAHGKAEFPDIVFTSTINYTCDEGYILNGTTTSSCMHDGKWSHPPPVCESVTCGLPPIPNYGQIIFDKTPVGNIVQFGSGGRYECNHQLVMFGDERAYCQANGRWTEPPECRPVVCPAPTEIPNGFITFAVRREHSYMERVKYGCNVNYVMDGLSEVVCEKTGQWSAKPVCRAPCTVNIKRGRIFYKAQKMWIEEFKPNRVLHLEYVAVYCLNKEKECGYPVASQCVDGTLKIPECFKEPSAARYQAWSHSLPSEIDRC
ncbi:beta-2-glycoprotein 1 [Clupea harengus]|uniref:Beta-2-glycoprotein 1 n=1 Tax=Clupea harengus TaxID=7950 RepID=A0A6P3VWK2_CLUHA|nr:beta-2-glycoprotein 1 [Clupea harengus]